MTTAGMAAAMMEVVAVLFRFPFAVNFREEL